MVVGFIADGTHVTVRRVSSDTVVEHFYVFKRILVNVAGAFVLISVSRLHLRLAENDSMAALSQQFPSGLIPRLIR